MVCPASPGGLNKGINIFLHPGAEKSIVLPTTVKKFAEYRSRPPPSRHEPNIQTAWTILLMPTVSRRIRFLSVAESHGQWTCRFVASDLFPPCPENSSTHGKGRIFCVRWGGRWGAFCRKRSMYWRSPPKTEEGGWVSTNRGQSRKRCFTLETDGGPSTKHFFEEILGQDAKTWTGKVR